jgi:hypothetical protein
LILLVILFKLTSNSSKIDLDKYQNIGNWSILILSLNFVKLLSTENLNNGFLG